MKYGPFLLAGVLASSFWIACNCGHIGQACSSTSECPSGEACVEGTCSLIGTGGDGGGGTDGGRTDGGRTDGGGGGGNDGGNTSDGGGGGGNDGGVVVGPCVNLQCQQTTCTNGGTTSLTGKVYDPSGTVPLYNAVVYVPNGTVQPFPTGLNCDTCGSLTTGSPLVITLTGPDGSFELKNVPVGQNIPLVLQIGHWRRQVTIPSVPSCVSTPITDVNLLRMPRNKSEGDMPRIAIAAANSDPFECLLHKMKISDTEFTIPSKNGRVHYYLANGVDLAQDSAPPASTLWSDAGTLANYDVVILPCEGQEAKKPDFALQNMIDYSDRGGRVFTTHYSYVWTAFAPEPFPSTANWTPDPGRNSDPPDPFTVDVDQSFPKGVAFAQWLVNVGASSALGKLDLHEARHNVTSTVAGKSTRWMSGSTAGLATPNEVPHLTFNTPVNPATLPDGGTAPQCGRVVFSDFHVTLLARTGQGTFPGECADGDYTPQEKALVFMLFDLSSCIQNDTVAPRACSSESQACTDNNSCCSGLSCLSSSGASCNGGANCACSVVFH